MYCTRCGGVLDRPGGTCKSCSASAVATRESDRMARHLRILAVLWILAGAFRLAMAVFFYALTQSDGLPDWAGVTLPLAIFMMLAVVLALQAAGALFAGWGLNGREKWARPLALVMAFLALPFPPFSTALGIYTLIVLLPASAQRRYAEVAHSAAAS